MPFRGGLAEGSLLLVYLLAVVGVAVLGGLVPALTAAAASFLLVNWFLTPPYYTLTVASSDAAVDLVVFVAVAVVVSVTVDLGARHREAAERNRFESRLVSELGSAEISGVSLAAVLERVRLLFDMTTVALLDPAEESGRPLAFVGPSRLVGRVWMAVSVNGLRLAAYGPEVFAEDRRLFRRWRSWRHAPGRTAAGRQAARAEQLAETDRVRSALLAAVGPRPANAAGRDQGRGLAACARRDVDWTRRRARANCCATIEESADRLDRPHRQPARDEPAPGRRRCPSTLGAGRAGRGRRGASLAPATAHRASRSTSPTTCRRCSPTPGCSSGSWPTWSTTPPATPGRRPPVESRARRRTRDRVALDDRRSRTRHTAARLGAACSRPSSGSATATPTAASDSAWRSRAGSPKRWAARSTAVDDTRRRTDHDRVLPVAP